MYLVIQEINLQNTRQKSDHIFDMKFGYPFYGINHIKPSKKLHIFGIQIFNIGTKYKTKIRCYDNDNNRFLMMSQ